MKRKTLFTIIILILVLMVSSFYFWKNSHENKDIPSSISKTSIKVSKNLYLIPVSPAGFKTNSQNSMKKIYIYNSDTNKKKLVYSSDIPMSISSLSNTEQITKDNNGNYLFVAYNFTEINNAKKQSQKKNENGYIFKITPSGDVTSVYKTKHIFVSATSSNKTITLYEKVYLDNMNIYPSYYKPYVLIKESYDGNTIKEIGRQKIDPTK